MKYLSVMEKMKVEAVYSISENFISTTFIGKPLKVH